MFSAILLGHKLDFVLDAKTRIALFKAGLESIEDTEQCTTYIGKILSKNKGEGAECLEVNFSIFHDTKDELLAAVAKSPEMSNWVRTSKEGMKLWHINLDN